MDSSDIMFSSGNDEYETPEFLFNTLNEVFEFTLDPCASELSHQVEHFFTIDDNGLEKSWAGETSFVNYPYSNGRVWMRKCATEFTMPKQEKGESVILCPARTDTKAFQDYVFPVATAITFLRGRLKFINRKGSQYVTLRLLLENYKNYHFKDFTNLHREITFGDRWKGNQPKLASFENAKARINHGENLHKVMTELMLSFMSGAPFPSCLIYYTSDVDKIVEASEELNGHTILI